MARWKIRDSRNAKGPSAIAGRKISGSGSTALSYAAANKAAHVVLGRQDTVTVLAIEVMMDYPGTLWGQAPLSAACHGRRSR